MGLVADGKTGSLFYSDGTTKTLRLTAGDANRGRMQDLLIAGGPPLVLPRDGGTPSLPCKYWKNRPFTLY